MTVHLGYYRAYLRCQALYALGNHQYFKISCQGFHQKYLKPFLYPSLLRLAFYLYRQILWLAMCCFLCVCVCVILYLRHQKLHNKKRWHYNFILSILFFLFLYRKWKKKRREGHDCIQVWWRGKFIVNNRESIARGRDWGTWESPQLQTVLAQWREEGKEEWEPDSAVREGWVQKVHKQNVWILQRRHSGVKAVQTLGWRVQGRGLSIPAIPCNRWLGTEECYRNLTTRSALIS